MADEIQYRALRAFRHRGVDYAPGDALPPKARTWVDLRSLQRRGEVSWEAGRKHAPPPLRVAAEVPAADHGDDEAPADGEPEDGAAERKPPRSAKRPRKRAAA